MMFHKVYGSLDNSLWLFNLLPAYHYKNISLRYLKTQLKTFQQKFFRKVAVHYNGQRKLPI